MGFTQDPFQGWTFLYLLLKSYTRYIREKKKNNAHLTELCLEKLTLFSERELMFMFAICRRASVCLSSVCRLSSVTFVHPTHPIEIFGNVSAPCNTLVT